MDAAGATGSQLVPPDGSSVGGTDTPPSTGAGRLPVVPGAPERRKIGKREFAVLVLKFPFCGVCKAPWTMEVGPTIDHVVPLSGGGSDDHENLQLLCWPCNNKKGGVRKPIGPILPMGTCPSCNRPTLSLVLYPWPGPGSPAICFSCIYKTYGGICQSCGEEHGEDFVGVGVQPWCRECLLGADVVRR